ncbi:MAG: hypothetical protein SX243_13875 [Acidobacteriota bacterium]|nr:hypothetical protein [Acidobacteriota bacterium]
MRLQPLLDPQATAAAFLPKGPERDRAIAEHQALLDCPWSPIPVYEALFADKEWTEIDFSPLAIVKNLEAAIACLEKDLPKD